MEDLIYRLSLNKKKRIRNLDNLQLLSAAYGQLNHAYGTRWLIDLAKGRDDHDKRRRSLLSVYLSQDTSMVAKMAGADPVASSIYSTLIDDRNRSWLVTISQNLQKTNFVYCGLLHLLSGDFALLKILKSQGYTIEPIYILTRR